MPHDKSSAPIAESMPADRMTLEQIATAAAEVGALQEQHKRFAMIYQGERKREVARNNGVPLDSYYHLPFAQWCAIDAADYAKERGVNNAEH